MITWMDLGILTLTFHDVLGVTVQHGDREYETFHVIEFFLLCYHHYLMSSFEIALKSCLSEYFVVISCHLKKKEAHQVLCWCMFTPTFIYFLIVIMMLMGQYVKDTATFKFMIPHVKPCCSKGYWSHTEY